MSILISHGKEVTNIFQLLGTLENDITKSIAWAMNNCPDFLRCLIAEIANVQIDFEKVVINYQLSEKGSGRTDLEITDNEKIHIIIEAKRGWSLPEKQQLELYSNRKSINESNAKNKMIVTMSECSEEYAKMYTPDTEINGKKIIHLSWKTITRITREAISKSNNNQKYLLRELENYLRGVMTMQDKNSNWVYVVSLAQGNPGNCELSWIDITKLKGIYFHPISNNWPKNPVNYIAFRYNGRLQSIHHVDSYKVTRNLHTVISEMPNKEEDCEYYVYKLGAPIIPSKVVKTGKIYRSGRVWAMMDTLLTADTISDARDISNGRLNEN